MKQLAAYPLHAKTIVLPKRSEDQVNKSNRRTYNRGDILLDTYIIYDFYTVPSGESEVYFCTKGEEKYAFKLYYKGHEGDIETRANIQSIDSKYVMKIIASGYLDDRYYEVLPFYKNGSLITSLELLSEDFVLDVVIPCVNEGLHAIHEQGLLHRDIKPHNLFLSDDMSYVVIGDFGVVKALDEEEYVITKSPLTIRYSAPETAKGISAKASDYYSFGMTILDLLFGKDLYAQLQDKDIERNMLYYGIRLPRDISLDVRDLIAAMVQTSPQRRADFKSVKAWIEDHSYFHGVSTFLDRDDKDSIRPFRFQGQYHHTLGSLARVLNLHWNEALALMGENLLLPHLKHTHKERYLRIQEILRKTSDLDAKLSIVLSMMTPDTIILYKGKEHTFDDFTSNAINLHTAKKRSPQADTLLDILSILYWQQTTSATLQELLFRLFQSDNINKKDWLCVLLSKDEKLVYRRVIYPTYVDLVSNLIEQEFEQNENLYAVLQDALFQSIMSYKFDDYVPIQSTDDPTKDAMSYQFLITGELPIQLGTKRYQTIGALFNTLKTGFEKYERFTKNNVVAMLSNPYFKHYLSLYLHHSFGPDKVNRILNLFEQYDKQDTMKNEQIAYLIYLYFTDGDYYYNHTHNVRVETLKELLLFLSSCNDLETISKDLRQDWMFSYWLDKRQKLEYVLGGLQ